MRSTILHPRTLLPLRPVGFRKNGRPILPILGGSEPPNQPPGTQPPANQPERPDGVSEAEWAALGDPGKTALVRERQRAAAAEQALAAERAKQQPPKPTPPKTDPPKPPAPGEPPDIDAVINRAVQQAVAPFLERDQQREAEQAASAIRQAVLTEATARFHDPADALLRIDATTVTDGNGGPDAQKIRSALDEVLTKSPHLGKAIDPRRQTPPGTPLGGGGGGNVPLDDRVKATLTRMQQQAAGVRFADPSNA